MSLILSSFIFVQKLASNFNHIDLDFCLQLLGTLVDCNSLIRTAARLVLHLTRMDNIAMFKLCFEGLVKNLKMYPQVPTLWYASFFVRQWPSEFEPLFFIILPLGLIPFVSFLWMKKKRSNLLRWKYN